MLRKLLFLPLALPVALFVGCEGTTQNDTATDTALESCFTASSDGATKCALQTAGFSRDSQDVDHDGHPDAFVCAHLVKVPHGSPGAGGASGAPSTGSGGARPSVPTDCDCDHMGCQDQRPHRDGAGAGGNDGSGPTSGPTAPSDAATALTPAGDGDDMMCRATAARVVTVPAARVRPREMAPESRATARVVQALLGVALAAQALLDVALESRARAARALLDVAPEGRAPATARAALAPPRDASVFHR